VVLTTCNLSLCSFSFLILLHQSSKICNDLRQLSLGQVKALEYCRYDINGYRFRTAKLEASHPLAATTSNGLVASDEDATSHVTDYYNIL
jgi:hypothetical protein